MMFTIIEIMIYFISSYFLFSIIKCLVTPRRPKLVQFFSFLPLFFICSAIIFPDDAAGPLITLVGFLLYIFLFFEGESIKKLSVTFIVFPILISINYLSEDIGYQIWYNYQEMSEFASDFLHCGSVLLRIPAWYGVWRLSRAWTKHAYLLNYRMWLIIDTLCMASFVGVLTVINLTPINSNPLISYPTILSSLLTCIGSLYLFSYIAKTIKSNAELTNLKYQESYYAELEQSQKSIRKLRHDMLNHINVLGAFVHNKEYEKAEAYFHELSGEFTVTNRFFCKNSIVNAVLNAKYNLALANQIDCLFNISINGLMGIHDINLCTLFANTLDNAIEANEKIPDIKNRQLSLKARFDKGFFSYEISNAKTNTIQTKKNQFLTDKADKSSHGFGLQSVVDIVEKYGGNIDISHTDTTFTITILIGNL